MLSFHGKLMTISLEVQRGNVVGWGREVTAYNKEQGFMERLVGLLGRQASSCAQLTVRPKNTKTSRVWSREMLTAGPCKEMGGSCLKKKPELPKSF